MKKVFDNIEEFNKEIQDYESYMREDAELFRRRMERALRAHLLRYSQYKRTFSPEYWKKLEGYYEILCGIAKECGGRVELKLEDDTLDATLFYTGKNIQLDRVSSLNNAPMFDFVAFSEIFASADSFSLMARDNSFAFSFQFSPYTTKQVADYSEKIAELLSDDDADLTDN